MLEAQNIVRVSMSILRNDDFDSTVKPLLHGCKNKIGAKLGYVAISSDDGLDNEIVYQEPEGCRCRGDLKVHHHVSDFLKEVQISGRTKYCNDSNRTDFIRFMPSEYANLNNVMFVPLMIEGKFRGLLALFDKDGGFTDRDASLAEYYGKITALALSNYWNKGFSESRERGFRELFDGAFDAIVSLDDKDNIVFANKTFYKMFSGSSGAPGENISKLFGRCDLPFADGIHHLSAITVGDRDFHLEMSVSNLAMGENGVKVVIIRDVSNEKAHEKVMQLVRRKLELMGKITRHDVMNHIMVLQGFLDLSYDAGVPISDKYYSRMSQSMEKISALYSLQRDFEALGSSASEWINTQDAMSRAQELLDERIGAIIVQADVKVSLWADHLLEKVFYNLLHNSMVHGERVSRIILKSQVRNGELLLDFIDDGIGIPVDDKNSLFSLGFGKSFGQGLFLVKEILATYDMVIEEIGEPGKGAVFRISVPPRHWMKG